ncbi:hypothetical protein BIW11_03688 [Tropilaelaps mercedesae]|uniref:Thioredoxin domain-containing protein n=1 Tax=Tropilaelaps mercedesae TaxID=418985 RepID=A0A1V9XHL8_9ACAR|nr:hypothetical protein BIW11_03688 [Tropilaelaps mercedesae]
MGWAFTVSVPSVFITLLSVLVILPYGFPLWNLQKHREKVTPLSLFTFNDQVRSLGTMHEVENMLNEKNDVDMILFYAHWCGHCQKFAPHFRKFAEDVRGWWPVLHIGAVNCAVSSDICSHYNVTFYPAIQLFWKEESAEGDRPVEIMDTLKYELLHAAVIDFIEKHVKSGVASRVLPDLSPNRYDLT